MEDLTFFILSFVLIGATLVFKKFFSQIRLDAEGYQSKAPSLLLLRQPRVWILGVAPSILLLVLHRESAYSAYPNAEVLRILVALICLPITWQLCTYEFNYFYNRWHWDFRLILPLLNVLIFIHPAPLPLFLCLMHASNGQFSQGHGGYWTFSDKELPVFILVCFYLFQIPHTIWPDLQFEILFFSAFTLVIALYTSAALRKLQLKGYFKYAGIHLLLVSSYLNGWLLLGSLRNALNLAKRFRPLSPILAVITVLVEVSGLVTLFEPTLLIPWLISVILFHLLVFILGGILFWKWIWVVSVLLFYSFSTDTLWAFEHSIPHLGFVVVMSVFLFFTGKMFNPSWYTVAYAYNFHFILNLGDQGKLRLSPAFFSPFDTMFSQGRFWFLVDQKRKIASHVGSVMESEMVKKINATPNQESFKSLQEQFGTDKYFKKKEALFKDFLKTFLTNKLGSDYKVSKWIQPPRHLYYFGATQLPQIRSNNVSLEIELEEWTFAQGEVTNLDKTSILTLEL